LEFEVASIKPSGPRPPPEVLARMPRIRTGPVYFFYPLQSLFGLVRMAYGLELNQVFIPDALKDERYDINAKAPEGTTEEQAKLMWQNLLADRFHLVYHRESRVMPVWELTVAKGGVKMLDSSLGKPDDPRASPLPEQKVGGPLWLPPGITDIRSYTRSDDGVSLMAGRQARLSDVARQLEGFLRQAGDSKGVLDKTGLSGTYDFGIQFVAPRDEDRQYSKPTDALGLFTAVEQYLGLKIEDAKRPIEVLVVDKADRVPTEN
jgi:uncharacterized protein (TIGR03435 family)